MPVCQDAFWSMAELFFVSRADPSIFQAGWERKAWLMDRSHTQKVPPPPPPLPWIASFSESVDSELILRVFTCSVSHTLPAGTITSLSDYSLPPTVPPVYKNTSRSPRLGCHMYTPFHPPSPVSSGGFLLHLLWDSGVGTVAVRFSFFFLQHDVQQETANWSVKQGYSLQVATG